MSDFMDLEHITASFARRRAALGLSLREVAQIAGECGYSITHMTVSNAERTKDPGKMALETVLAIHAALSLAEAAEREDENESKLALLV